MCYETGPMTNVNWSKRHILTVSELTQNIKELLEDEYPFIWLSGEISNLRTAASGHLYFTLKDSEAQISGVMFRGQNRHLGFQLENGITVIAMGRLNVYEARGVYQVIVEYVEPGGLGALQLAFEQLKEKLALEGLFDDKYKRPIPFLPKKIAVITSPRGAAMHDVLNVVERRFSNMNISIVPVKVQGKEAAEEIADALLFVNKHDLADVIILTRGGGSLEDLQAYNSEIVARAIFSSHISVVSAVGHEIDFTISDFTADLRAPTPSAAAELVVPEKEVLSRNIEGFKESLKRTIIQRIKRLNERVSQVSDRLVHPRRQITECRLRLDDIAARMQGKYLRWLERNKDSLDVLLHRLARCSPQNAVRELNIMLAGYRQNLLSATHFLLDSKINKFEIAVGRLNALNPLAILSRGYSITRRLTDGILVKDIKQVDVGHRVAVTLSKGQMVCCVERKQYDG